METRRRRLWHTIREYVTHWSVAGAILAATGTAPEHWLADFLHAVHLPRDFLPSWLDHMDYRLVAVIAGLSIIVGDNLWRHHGRHWSLAALPAAASEQAGLPLPERPSIAVLPLTNLNGDPAQEYFSDGVADDIIMELSRDRGLFVIAVIRVLPIAAAQSISSKSAANWVCGML